MSKKKVEMKNPVYELLDELRTEKNRDSSLGQVINLMKTSIEPQIARMTKPQLVEALADAVYAMYCMEDEIYLYEDAIKDINQKHGALKLHLTRDIQRRKNQDKARIFNRQDQVDKRAFQDMVKNNIGKYATKADALHALKTISQFTDYPDTTLRAWLKDESVWTKPTKPGRPAKTKK